MSALLPWPDDGPPFPRLDDPEWADVLARRDWLLRKLSRAGLVPDEAEELMRIARGIIERLDEKLRGTPPAPPAPPEDRP